MSRDRGSSHVCAPGSCPAGNTAVGAASSGCYLHGGGRNPSMNFYANYVVFDSPAPMNAAEGPHQIFMRYLGPV